MGGNVRSFDVTLNNNKDNDSWMVMMTLDDDSDDYYDEWVDRSDVDE